MAENELLNDPGEMAGTVPLVDEVDVFALVAVVVVFDELPHAAIAAPTPTASTAVRNQ
jgi:hypothetical protein